MPVNDAFWDHQAELLYKLLFPMFVRMAKKAARNGAAAIPTTVEFGIDWALVNEAVISWATTYTAQVVAQITRTSMDAFTVNFGPWVQSGQPLSALVDALAPYYGPVRAEMVAVTEVTRSFQEGNLLAWKESGVVDGFIYHTGIDDLVCPVCAPLEGRVYLLDDSEHSPPLHVRCRCYSAPKVNI